VALEKGKGKAEGNDRINQSRDVPLNQGYIKGRPINLEQGESSGTKEIHMSEIVVLVQDEKGELREETGFEEHTFKGEASSRTAREPFENYSKSLFCNRCKRPRHVYKDCRRGWLGDKSGQFQNDQYDIESRSLMEMVAPLCDAQAEGQAFFCILDIPSQVNVRYRANTTIVTIIKGLVTTKQLQDEFTRLLSSVWRWTARRVAGNKFTVRFPTSQLIKDWGRFNLVKMRTTNAKIQIDPEPRLNSRMHGSELGDAT
jgi:hypothetical protein